MKQATEIGARHNRNEEFENETILEGHPITLGNSIMIPDDMLQIAHCCVLINSSEVQPYLEMHAEELKLLDRRFLREAALLHSRQMDTFAQWLKAKIESCGNEVSDRLKWLQLAQENMQRLIWAMSLMGITFIQVMPKGPHKIAVFPLKQKLFVDLVKKTLHKFLKKICFYGVIRDIIL